MSQNIKIIIVGIIGIIIGVVFAYFCLIKNQSYTQHRPQPKDDVFKQQEMISQDTENVAEFQGYYLKRTVPGGDYAGSYLATSTCDSFLILNGNQNLINYFKVMAYEGNTVNEITDNNKLVINLDLGNLTDLTKGKILNSNKDIPVILTLKKLIPLETGGDVCYNFFNVLE